MGKPCTPCWLHSRAPGTEFITVSDDDGRENKGLGPRSACSFRHRLFRLSCRQSPFPVPRDTRVLCKSCVRRCSPSADDRSQRQSGCFCPCSDAVDPARWLTQVALGAPNAKRSLQTACCRRPLDLLKDQRTEPRGGASGPCGSNLGPNQLKVGGLLRGPSCT